MELTLDQLLAGKPTKIRTKDYFPTKAYVEPFLDFMGKFTNDFRIDVKTPTQMTTSNGNTKNDGDKIGTGNRINVTNGTDNSIYTYVLFGDLTGDGEINSADLLKMRQHLLGISIKTVLFSFLDP